jgi:hypothetical protein
MQQSYGCAQTAEPAVANTKSYSRGANNKKHCCNMQADHHAGQWDAMAACAVQEFQRTCVLLVRFKKAKSRPCNGSVRDSGGKLEEKGKDWKESLGKKNSGGRKGEFFLDE